MQAFVIPFYIHTGEPTIECITLVLLKLKHSKINPLANYADVKTLILQKILKLVIPINARYVIINL